MTNRPEDWPSTLPPELLQRLLQSMGREEFDRFVTELWKEHGWETTNDTDSAAVLASTAGESGPQYAIHTTEYRTAEVNGELVARYSKEYANSEQVTPVIVTTGRFSWEAEERADIWRVKLVDGDDLIDRIESANAYDIINTYSPIPSSPHTASEVETLLAQQDQTFKADRGQTPTVETSPPPPWLTVLPGISLERDWIRRFAMLAVAMVTLVPLYNILPPGGPLVLRLVRTTTYFAILASLTGMFISFYMDMKLIQRAETYWNPQPLVYLPLVTFSFGLIWLLYFYKRWYHFGRLLKTPPTETDPVEI